MAYKIFAIFIIFCFETASANTLTHLVRSHPCSGGKNLGLYIAKFAGVESVVGYCNFETLRGYKSNQYEPTTEKDKAIVDKCLDEDSDEWVRSCYENYKNNCMETKKIKQGYSESVQTYIKESCLKVQGVGTGSTPGNR